MVCNVQRAVVLLYLGKAEVVATRNGRTIRSVNSSMPFPSIVRLARFVHRPWKKIILSRKNILRRDNYQCQYCGKRTTDLTIDHVIPKAIGGKDTWENLVTACMKCNNKKGNHHPDEIGMHLMRQPRRPSHLLFIQTAIGVPDDQWRPYLFLQ